MLEVSKVGGYSRPGNDGGHIDAKSAQSGEQPTLVGQRVRARGGGTQSGERPKTSFYPKDATAVAGSLQPPAHLPLRVFLMGSVDFTALRASKTATAASKNETLVGEGNSGLGRFFTMRVELGRYLRSLRG